MSVHLYQGPPSASAPAKKADIRLQHKPFTPINYGIRAQAELPPTPAPVMTSAPTRVVTSVHQAGVQGRVQYHDLSNNNTGVVGVERQDSYTGTQHQVSVSLVTKPVLL